MFNDSHFLPCSVVVYFTGLEYKVRRNTCWYFGFPVMSKLCELLFNLGVLIIIFFFLNALK